MTPERIAAFLNEVTDSAEASAALVSATLADLERDGIVVRSADSYQVQSQGAAPSAGPGSDLADMTIAEALDRLGVPRQDWAEYLGKLGLEMMWAADGELLIRVAAGSRPISATTAHKSLILGGEK